MRYTAAPLARTKGGARAAPPGPDAVPRPRPPTRLPAPIRRLALAAVTFAWLVVGIVSPAIAQVREFPPNTRLGVLRMGAYPEASIDGQPVRFAPGARIRDRANMLVLPGSLDGAARVRFTTDTLGLVDRAWVLTDEEIAQAAKDRR